MFAALTTLIPEPELPAEVLKRVKKEDGKSGAKGKRSEEQSLWTAGILTAVGISAHNVPEGIAGACAPSSSSSSCLLVMSRCFHESRS